MKQPKPPTAKQLRWQRLVAQENDNREVREEMAKAARIAATIRSHKK